MRDAEHTYLSSAVTGCDFVVEFFDEQESLWVPALWSRHTNVTPEPGLSRTLHKSTEHQLFADVAYTRSIDGRTEA